MKRFFISTSTADSGLISITDPTLRCDKILLSECALMKSKKKPQKILFNNFDSIYPLGKGRFKTYLLEELICSFN